MGQFTPLEGKLHESGDVRYILATCKSAWRISGGQHVLIDIMGRWLQLHYEDSSVFAKMSGLYPVAIEGF